MAIPKATVKLAGAIEVTPSAATLKVDAFEDLSRVQSPGNIISRAHVRGNQGDGKRSGAFDEGSRTVCAEAVDYVGIVKHIPRDLLSVCRAVIREIQRLDKGEIATRRRGRKRRIRWP